MKRLIEYSFIAALLALTATSCAIDVIQVDQSKLPVANDLTPIVTVDDETNLVTFNIVETDVVPIWYFGDAIVDGAANKSEARTGANVSAVFNEKGTHSVELKAYNSHGISIDSQIVTFETLQDIGLESDVDSWDDSVNNLWLDATYEVSFWFADDDWIQIDDPAYTTDGSTHTITVPSGVGSTQWQAQMSFNNTGISTSSTSYYNFQVVIKASCDISGATVKLTDQNDDSIYYFADRIDLSANTSYVYQVRGMEGLDINDIQLVFDFAGATDGSTIEISKIILREVSGAVWDASSESNLWVHGTATLSYWFADDDWIQISDPETVDTGSGYTITLTEGLGSSQWQGQFSFNDTGVSTSAGTLYDFQIVILSDETLPSVTIKLTDQNDDTTYYFADIHSVSASEDYIYQMEGMSGIDIDEVQLVLDFGGCPGGAKVTVSDIVIRVSE